MALPRKKKRSKLTHHQPQRLGLFDLPDDLRRRIQSYFCEKLYADYAAISKRCYQECKNAEMPPAAKSITVSAVQRPCRRDGGGIETILWKLSAAARPQCRAFHQGSRLTHLTIVKYGGHAVVTNKCAKPYLRRTVLPSVTSLDISFPKTCSKTSRKVAACLPRFLAPMLPNLLELDISYTVMTIGALCEFIYNCPKLEAITSNGGPSLSVTGEKLDQIQTLKEIYVDDTRFETGNSTLFDEDMFQTEYMETEDSPFVIFGSIIDKLERVSLLNATFCGYYARTRPKPVTQIGLMKFVRRAKKLRWFRSNLTGENIEILAKERPDVEFVSPMSVAGEEEEDEEES